ncbi:Anti-sigma-B factor antagonist [Streptomyces sp. enrichment culture]|uniref:STAS domain-containing protein n=1 Tax=Streptomyces sp. enrichment culture TaxID=1795815 RepID=UPI003F548A68
MSQARLTVSRHGTADGVRVLTLAGEIDHTTAGVFRRALAAEDGCARRTVLDLRGVTFMDSSGINVLVAANNAARAHGGWLRLAHTPEPLTDLLRIVCLDEVVPLYPTLDQALAPHAPA